MVKDKLQIVKNQKLGFKLSLVHVIPTLVSGLVLTLFKFEYEPMTFFKGVVLGFAIMLSFYLYGYFVNKWKKWIFK